jgi:hypothetical protein
LFVLFFHFQFGSIGSLFLTLQKPDPRKIQISVTGFLGKNAARLMEELWGLLIDAQASGGIPRSLLEDKKAEIKKRIVWNVGRRRRRMARFQFISLVVGLFII